MARVKEGSTQASKQASKGGGGGRAQYLVGT
jgi:hypothetical protein